MKNYYDLIAKATLDPCEYENRIDQKEYRRIHAMMREYRSLPMNSPRKRSLFAKISSAMNSYDLKYSQLQW